MGHPTPLSISEENSNVQKKKKELKRIKRFIWVNGPQWIFPQKGGKNKQVDISVWTEARRQEILCNVTMST